jgi:GrpB-like predicted nucleotidyltransferase (UPF0157 family)
VVEIVAYREEWPAEFRRIAAALSEALGVLAPRIDHIGSTSVPGLAAKDVIDVQVTVTALEPIGRLAAALSAAGYTLVPEIARDHRPPGAAGPDTDWEKRFARPPAGQRRTNVHVRVLGRPNHRYALLFRDYLCSHPMAAAAYAELKRRLAAVPGMEVSDYAEIKDPVCDIVMVAAEAWAVVTGWRVDR